MQCPIDQTELVMTHRDGIEIDYCPKCRGVWLDRGELDKIIERAAERENPGPRYDREGPDFDYERKRKDDYTPYRDDDDYDYDRRQRPPYKKRKSFLGEMFDIFD